jgi:hypothetical protein
VGGRAGRPITHMTVTAWESPRAGLSGGHSRRTRHRQAWAGGAQGQAVEVLAEQLDLRVTRPGRVARVVQAGRQVGRQA